MSSTSGRRRETPIKRVNPSGEVVWVARYTNSEGRRVVAKPAWNGYRGTFKLRRDAQRAIDEAYGLPDQIDTLGAYFKRWPLLHPRTPRTQETNEHRLTRALPVEIDGRPLRDWPFNELRRRHVYALVDVLLAKQGRSALGATHIVRALSVMTEDAITDDVAELNPFKGVSVRANDPRVKKRPRRIRVYSWSEMHAFARAATVHPKTGRPDPSRQLYESMIRCFCDAGMRLGEVLPLRREDLDGELFSVRRTAHEGKVQEGTKTDHGETEAGRRTPCPPTLAKLIRALAPRIDTPLLFPTPTGKLWRERNFYRDVWYPAQESSGLDIRPHEMRHSWETHLTAMGVNPADLAQMAGHTVETMMRHYTHALDRSFDQVRELIG